jgi:hypothetical protein
MTADNMQFQQAGMNNGSFAPYELRARYIYTTKWRIPNSKGNNSAGWSSREKHDAAKDERASNILSEHPRDTLSNEQVAERKMPKYLRLGDISAS